MLGSHRNKALAPIYATAKLVPSLGQGDGGLKELSTEMHGVGNSHQVFYLMLRRWGYNRHEQHSAKKLVCFELLVSGGWRPQRVWYGVPRCE